MVGIGSVVDVETDGGQTMTVEVSAVGGAGNGLADLAARLALLGRTVGDTVEVAGAARRLARDGPRHSLAGDVHGGSGARTGADCKL